MFTGLKNGKEKKWYAVYTKSRHEKKVAGLLMEKGIEHYLPLQKTLKQWSDRKKMVEEPLIRSYIFVNITMQEYYPVLETQGIVKFIHFEGKLVPIPEWQLQNIKILLDSETTFYKTIHNYQAGDMVEINQGSLIGLKGAIVQVKGTKKLLIHLDVLEQNFLVNIHPASVEPVRLQKSI